MALLRAAKDLHLPPILLADDTDTERAVTWNLRDRILMRGLAAYEASLCDGCRQDRAKAMNPETAGHWQVHPHPCYSCATAEQVREQQKGERGIKNYIVYAGPAELEPHVIELRPIDQTLYDEITAMPGEASRPGDAPGL